VAKKLRFYYEKTIISSAKTMKLAHIVVVLTMLSASLTIRAEQPLPMTKVAEIRRLSRAQAGQAIPVKITGVCISYFHGVNIRGFVINDGQESIWVQVLSNELDSLDIHRGAQLVVEGVTDPAAYGPAIIAKRVQRLGEAPLPSPIHPELESLLSGNEDCQWIEVEGVVQAAYQQGPLGLGALLLLDGIPCRLGSAGVPRDFGRFVDARIRVRSGGAAVPRKVTQKHLFMSTPTTTSQPMRALYP
jgi:hypothetical protein